MRTTVTLDPDVETVLRQAVRRSGAPFKQVLNDAVREGRPFPNGAVNQVGKIGSMKRIDVHLTRELQVRGRVRYGAEQRLAADDHKLVLARDRGCRAQHVL